MGQIRLWAFFNLGLWAMAIGLGFHFHCLSFPLLHIYFQLNQMDTHPQDQQSKHDRSRTKWTASLDKLFVDLVLEQVLLGNRSNNVFNKNAWKHIRDEFNKQTGLDFNRKQLKKHLDVLRNRYDNVKSQLLQGSFGGDESRHIFVTGAEVWDNFIEDYPMGEPTRSKDSPIYDQLCKIFSESGGIGRYAQSSHYIEVDKETIGMETPRSAPTIVQDDSSSRSGVDVNLDSNKRKPVTQTNPRTRRKSNNEFDDAMAEAMIEMATASKLRANASIQCLDQFSITKCVQVLDEISNVDESLYYAALDLFDNPNLREMFLSLKDEKRLLWLQHKCTASFSSTLIHYKLRYGMRPMISGFQTICATIQCDMMELHADLIPFVPLLLCSLYMQIQYGFEGCGK
ncbi:hypothetical protein IFM89_014741 [Coptis chinensis]|uniref:Myb/SANT-like domain-containing protein n=1 Tax=Coptis chinensis TaxID=261450 RepID=A0A835IP52_9MAGN|nr:hypothetical protein IFM89_014741 [Coptis chinensis]